MSPILRGLQMVRRIAETLPRVILKGAVRMIMPYMVLLASLEGLGLPSIM